MIASGTRAVGLALFVSITSYAAVTASPARADDGAPGVARVHILDGDVDIKRADAQETVAAVVNAPMSVGDYVSTHDGARTEIELGDRTALRVAPDSQLRFTRIDPDATALQLAAGTVDARLFDGVGAHPEIDVPNAKVTPQRSGSYRVTVDDDGNSRVTVRSGTAVIATNDDSTQIDAGTTVVIEGGNGDDARFERADTLPSDGFDAWNAQRDDDERNVPSYSYLDDRYVGADDLDRYGSWQDVSGYGNVWHPSYASDWAPYSDGRFSWEPYYGWTWVSAEPWGWAPYHYGRWFDAPGVGWCWDPGRTVAVAYEPALVTFFSFGGAGLSIGFGNIGWVPLAPNEAFHPWWGNGFGYGGYGGYGDRTVVNTITNITNVTNITNYQNYNAPGGVVALRRENFEAGRFDRRTIVSGASLRAEHPTAIRGVVPAIPTKSNLAYGGRIVTRPQPLAPRFAHFAAPATRVASFDAQRDGVRSIAMKQYPERAEAFRTDAPVERTAGERSERNDTVTDRATGRALSPAATAQKPASVWDRFQKTDSASRSIAPRTEARTGEPRAVEQRSTGARTATPAETAPREGTAREEGAAPRVRTSDPWSRFSTGTKNADARPERVQPQAPSAERSTHPTYTEPRTYAEPKANAEPRTYAEPRTHAEPRTYEPARHASHDTERAYHASASTESHRSRPAYVPPTRASRSSAPEPSERKANDASRERPQTVTHVRG